MKWTEGHKVLILRELMVLQPWKKTNVSSERGEDWEKLAVSLNATSHPQFHVTQQSVRDHYSVMEKRRKRKVREEERASGIAPEEETELEQLLNKIIELFEQGDKDMKEIKQNQEDEAKKAEEMRKLLKMEVEKGMSMNNKEENRTNIELVEQTLRLT